MKILLFGLAVVATLWGCPNSALAEVKQLDCVYQKFHTDADTRLQNVKDFKLQFTIDTVTNKAFVVGNEGAEEVTLVTGSDGMTFLEFLPTGAVQTTTVAHNGSSVHSRHSLLIGEIS